MFHLLSFVFPSFHLWPRYCLSPKWYDTDIIYLEKQLGLPFICHITPDGNTRWHVTKASLVTFCSQLVCQWGMWKLELSTKDRQYNWIGVFQVFWMPLECVFFAILLSLHWPESAIVMPLCDKGSHHLVVGKKEVASHTASNHLCL